MSKLLFNNMEITSNEHFITCSRWCGTGRPMPITIFHGKLKYYAAWNSIRNIEFLSEEVIRSTISMQSLEIFESEEVESEYNIKILNIIPACYDAYTEIILELQNKKRGES